MISQLDWSPFVPQAPGLRAEPPRAITTRDGVGDRLRAAAFAELQALRAFRWAAEHYTDAPQALRTAWLGLAEAEERHLGWLLRRMQELGIDPKGRAVSTQLWGSLVACASARDFAHYMAGAEERGRRAGERFHEQLLQTDPITADIFGRIAEEEIEHIRLAERYYPTQWPAQRPDDPKPLSPRAV